MAGGQERVLRRRIRTVQATKKITRAFELIAASQIVRAQGRLAGSGPYQRGIAEILADAAADAGHNAGRLLGVPDSPRRVLVVCVVADRGLCGAYNANVLRLTERTVRSLAAEGVEVTLMSVGKKAQSYFRFRRLDLARSFLGFSDRPVFEDARAVADALAPPFLAEEVDQVLIVSTRFLSAGSQAVEVRQLLPLPEPAGEDGRHGAPDRADAAHEGVSADAASRGAGGYTEFEPESPELLVDLVPRYVESAVFGALLEAAASEHTARQRAMAAATDNADELSKTLTREMNRARQDAITTEIMEIVGGAEALRQADAAKAT
ncbi:MAG TPA: ATP synthase F1 subunit gamma [Acidimicrobiales bacterium]|nr:ATP synthase F1 subunit gamma [Acidimicrobiales bacterium]